jgi:hypothetical protein
MCTVHAGWLQLVPDIRPLHTRHSHRSARLPLSHELTQQLPEQLLQQQTWLRRVRHVHFRLFLLLVCQLGLLRLLEPVFHTPRHLLSS